MFISVRRRLLPLRHLVLNDDRHGTVGHKDQTASIKCLRAGDSKAVDANLDIWRWQGDVQMTKRFVKML